MLGLYENFPLTIHRTDNYTTPLSKKKLQEKLSQVFQKINQETFSFEQVGNPTEPGCSVIFEFGIAETDGFVFLSEEETKRLLAALAEEPLQVMDWFVGIRYYKNAKEKKQPLKFDYYMLRMNFGEKGTVTMQVFHEKGPRYIAPEDLTTFITRKVNGTSKKGNILKPIKDS